MRIKNEKAVQKMKSLILRLHFANLKFKKAFAKIKMRKVSTKESFYP